MSNLFSLGCIVATPSALALLEETQTNMRKLIERHQSGDYGQLGDEDINSNNAAIRDNLRILSSYPVNKDDEKVWIITETDRSVTTILPPEDY